jgi:hypothetical protein
MTCSGWAGRLGDFGVFWVSFEGFHFQILNHMVEPCPCVDNLN